MSTEQWKPVVGYEGWYEVSDQGRVKRVGKAAGARVGRVLRPGVSAGRCLFVVLHRNGVRNQVLVQHLVAAAFIGPRPEGFHVHHKNGRSKDNRATNLAYTESWEHCSHHKRGENSPSARLTETDVRRIRRQAAEGCPQSALAKETGMVQSNISRIVTRDTWKHVS